MFANYLKIAWRNLIKNRMYSVINIGGLAVGMTVAILIGLWVHDELTYNHTHKNYENIAHIYRGFTEPLDQKSGSSHAVPQTVAKVLTEKYGHLFKHVVLLWWENDYGIRIGEKNFSKKGLFINDGVIDMFSLNMLKGSEHSLGDARSIILSESTARALFGDNDPVNQTIKLNNSLDVLITGVYADIAPNSIFGSIQFFANVENLKANTDNIRNNENNWGHNAYRVFVQTADNVSMDQANAAIHDIYLKDSPGDFVENAKRYNLNTWLFPAKDWYLYSEFENGRPAGGRITFVWLFGIVGVFVLLLACINFMNLSTARNEKRAKEVGIRKAIGSMKSQLVNQFLSESFLVVFIAFVISIILVAASIAPFNEMADKAIRLPFTNSYFWSASVAFLVLTALLAGIYPAFYLSSFQPVKVLKGTLRVGRYAALPRKILVVIQVTVSVVLIIGTVIVYQQIEYAQNRPVGYDKEGLIRIPGSDPESAKNKYVMREELLASGVATEVAFASSPVTAIWDNWGGFTWKGKNPEAESGFTVTWVNEDYGKAIRWKILQGRDFSREFGSDADAVIINRTAATYIGLENPIGELITKESSNQQRQIIGVVDDVVAVSPFEPVRPAFYWLEKEGPDNSLSQMLIKLNPALNTKDALSTIESIHHKLAPAATFNFEFVDQEYGVKFKAEQRVGKLASLFAVLAIFISCLGLFGLSSFVAEQKTKEIGVRKIVGATVFNIWSRLSREFIALVCISFIVAIPIAYYYLHQWLQTYNYHTEVDPLVFFYSGLSVLTITLITVSFHSIKAAISNPVKSLRSV